MTKNFPKEKKSKVLAKCGRKNLLQSVTKIYHKVRQVLQSVTKSYYEVCQVLQKMTKIITKSVRYYKV